MSPDPINLTSWKYIPEAWSTLMKLSSPPLSSSVNVPLRVLTRHKPWRSILVGPFLGPRRQLPLRGCRKLERLSLAVFLRVNLFSGRAISDIAPELCFIHQFYMHGFSRPEHLHRYQSCWFLLQHAMILKLPVAECRWESRKMQSGEYIYIWTRGPG